MKVAGINLYVGGSFVTVGGITVNRVARWNGTSWFALGNGFNDAVHALAVVNAELYTGGRYTRDAWETKDLRHFAK